MGTWKARFGAGRLVALLTIAWYTVAVAHADVVLDWNAIMVQTSGGQPPFTQARHASMTQLAVFEAVNAIDREYRPYLGSISAPPGASQEAAAIAAAHAVLRTLFPASAASLDAALASSLAALPDGADKQSGIAVGESAAAAIIALRTGDGSTPPQTYLPDSSAPGEWQLTPACPQTGGVFLHWANVETFGIHDSSQFRSERPPHLSSKQYAQDYQEVHQLGAGDSSRRSQDRADVAVLYNAALAPYLWNSVARQIARTRNDSLVRNARALALLNMAISDALVTVMETKYHYRFWRPETAIRAGGTDRNPFTRANEGFAPFIPTPCFPSYPSAHASASYAARAVLERLYGGRGHSIEVSIATVPGVVRQYTTLKALTRDIDDARVYGGIHFRFDQEAGATQGNRIGTYIYRHNLRPVWNGRWFDHEERSDTGEEQ